tara:strand:- start:945 stop:1052 length:108 start_codon:yes stop_codon:yes gene_type:complete
MYLIGKSVLLDKVTSIAEALNQNKKNQAYDANFKK